LPSGDRRTVEHRAVGQHVFVDQRKVERHMLPLAARIGEAQVDELDLLVLDRFQDVICIFLLSHDLSFPSNVEFSYIPRTRQIASAPVSPLRMRITSCTSSTKIFPSPMRPVRAAF